MRKQILSEKNRMKATLDLLAPPQPVPRKKAEGRHPIDCPCGPCVAQRKVETFAAIREVLKPSIPLQDLPLDMSADDLDLAREAAIMSMAAKALPKQKGRKEVHSGTDLLSLLLCVDKIQAGSPEMNDIQALRIISEKGRWSTTSIKVLQNLLGYARKRFRPEPSISAKRFLKALEAKPIKKTWKPPK